MRRPMLHCACVFTALAIGVSACGEDREGSVEKSGGSTSTTGTGAETSTAPAAGGPSVATVAVTETEFALDPENPRIAKAGVVTFRVKNAGKITHALEVEGPGEEVETEAIEPGKGATLKANLSKPGTYEWYCPIGDHESRGMKGEITVAGGGSGSKGSTSTTGEGSGSGKDDEPGSGKDDDSDKGGSGGY